MSLVGCHTEWNNSVAHLCPVRVGSMRFKAAEIIGGLGVAGICYIVATLTSVPLEKTRIGVVKIRILLATAPECSLGSLLRLRYGKIIGILG